ncbi:RidA family protein [Streptomyces sioyaensis]|uniref:RidA family protein n=1 Tax=Streptomyces sioyaensis TaxID=67364 RepID=UPI003D753C11
MARKDHEQTPGSSREQLISATVYVTDIANWPAFDQLYRARLGPARPARAVAGAKEAFVADPRREHRPRRRRA